MGAVLYGFARGQDNRPVVTEWERKSVSCEHTFERDINTDAEVAEKLRLCAEDLCRRMLKAQFQGQTLTLKVKFHDFTQITRSLTLLQHQRLPADADFILELALQLISKVDYATRPIRLMGLGVSNPGADGEPTSERWIQLMFNFER